jgi:hypothetical protein
MAVSRAPTDPPLAHGTVDSRRLPCFSRRGGYPKSDLIFRYFRSLNDNLANHSAGFMNGTRVPVRARHLEGVAESRTWLEETGIERFGTRGTANVAAIYGHRWISGCVMHFVTDIAPFNGVTEFDS